MTHEEVTTFEQWSKPEEDDEAVVFDDFEPDPPEWEDLIRCIKEIAAHGHLEARADAVMSWGNDVQGWANRLDEEADEDGVESPFTWDGKLADPKTLTADQLLVRFAWANDLHDEGLLTLGLDARAWAEHILSERYQGEMAERHRKVKAFRRDRSLPPLLDWAGDELKPDGSLYGIGFVYDEDRDDRVLVAIERLRDDPAIVAVREHEGTLTVWTREARQRGDMDDICGDIWRVEEMVPHGGRWVNVEDMSIPVSTSPAPPS